jgi:hypothetical protein
MKAIVTDNLTKKFGHLLAVDHISLYHLPGGVRDERIPRWKLTNEEWSKDSTRYSQSCQVMQVLGSQAVGKGASVNRN